MGQELDRTLQRVLKLRKRTLDQIQARIGASEQRERDLAAAAQARAARRETLAQPGPCVNPALLFESFRQLDSEAEIAARERRDAEAARETARGEAMAARAECEAIETLIDRRRAAARRQRAWP
jgi:hypothetical protein